VKWPSTCSIQSSTSWSTKLILHSASYANLHPKDLETTPLLDGADDVLDTDECLEVEFAGEGTVDDTADTGDASALEDLARYCEEMSSLDRPAVTLSAVYELPAGRLSVLLLELLVLDHMVYPRPSASWIFS
jgi:hypothetical protein